MKKRFTKPVTAAVPGGQKMAANIQNSEVENLMWYHPNIDRHIAETLLLRNSEDGGYLLRPSSNAGEFALSVRCRDAVKHYNVIWDGSHYKFGMVNFLNLQEFARHFENRPLVGGESGVLTILKSPYPHFVEEPTGHYDSVQIHAEFGRNRSMRESPNFAVGSKSGYLTKLGGRVKNWKTRWFCLVQNELKYYRHNTDKEPVRNLDLRDCSECARDNSMDKDNCFRLVFSWRTFYMYAAKDEDSNDWIKLLQWKLEKIKEASYVGGDL